MCTKTVIDTPKMRMEVRMTEAITNRGRYHEKCKKRLKGKPDGISMEIGIDIFRKQLRKINLQMLRREPTRDPVGSPAGGRLGEAETEGLF